MAVSTITLETVLDVLAAKNVPDPRNAPSGFGQDLAFNLANDVMADIVCERFNQKFNREVATPFLTNSYQQDYPQLAQPNGVIGWGEDCDIIDINNTQVPKPVNWDGSVTWVRQLTRARIATKRPRRIAWMYNAAMVWGTWPGAGMVYSPLLTSGPAPSNPIMNFQDANGNYLILTGFGTTGSTAPKAPADSAEGVTVNDGTCVWTVVDPQSQGFRLDVLAPDTGPVYQINPSYQKDPVRFSVYSQLLTPIPDSFSRYFYRGMEAQCLMASPNPGDRPRGETAYAVWMKALENAMKQGDREPNVYRLLPARPIAESRWGWDRPFTADDPI